MVKGRSCDNCGHQLSEQEFDKYGSWNYTCGRCGFKYNHNGKPVDEQVKDYINH